VHHRRGKIWQRRQSGHEAIRHRRRGGVCKGRGASGKDLTNGAGNSFWSGDSSGGVGALPSCGYRRSYFETQYGALSGMLVHCLNSGGGITERGGRIVVALNAAFCGMGGMW